MSLTDAMLDAAAEDVIISNALHALHTRLVRLGGIQIDSDPVNDNGGFTAICERSNCEAGVFVSMDNIPLVTVGMNLSDARPLIVGSANARRVTLEVRPPTTLTQGFRISCKRGESGRDGTQLLVFETKLSKFTKQREDLCVWLITTLFERAV